MATSLPIAQLEAFDPQVEAFTSYVELVHLFFETNYIKEEKQRSVLLSIVRGAVYNLLRNLLAPVTAKDASLHNIIAVLKAHYETKPIVIA